MVRLGRFIGRGGSSSHSILKHLSIQDEYRAAGFILYDILLEDFVPKVLLVSEAQDVKN